MRARNITFSTFVSLFMNDTIYQSRGWRYFALLSHAQLIIDRYFVVKQWVNRTSIAAAPILRLDVDYPKTLVL